MRVRDIANPLEFLAIAPEVDLDTTIGQCIHKEDT
jgi:hypothetical protein